MTQPVVIANNAYSKLLYGPNNVMSVPDSGTTASVASITLNDVKQFYAANYAPSVSYLTVVGDVDQAAAEQPLAFLKAWQQKNVTLPSPRLPRRSLTRRKSTSSIKMARRSRKSG